ncbi:SUPPRESSOR OF GAMMA RESPONSE 1 isoform X3 [Nicotiana tabacum]|uniref:NAC domain-containing protein 8 isoform X4 n=2 Tax=Nicotiana TaxID=4085 RepID=A0A1S3YVH6_TOBAC|nr:PREDICTED: NAC domain-containing protein 8 isoform X3 [Nicotiana sylvestris]XP_016456163.1 PREDICTED: NAC domain-containing protein 8-like isoform X4 [Nicotiana tabacum]XP_016456164.1 PREDICTED: NAC domain-containing protein 8-like isoform X4 [Nicotiana tabacum]
MRPSWLVDSKRIATKIKSASGDPGAVNWKSNPTKACPKCQFIIDNNDVSNDWPGLPRGVKFDPTDQEIIWHLLGKVEVGSRSSHPFIDEFIPTVDEDDGICYTHPQNLPGVKQDGSVSHFFHRAIKAYNTGTRKRRKIHGDNFGDVRWHKTGRTKPVILDGIQRGCKKIMVLYISPVKGGKAEKTNWVMHQYHLGTGEDEREGEYVVSKVFYQQQQQVKQGDKIEQELPEDADYLVAKVDPHTPKSVTPEPPRGERISSSMDARQQIAASSISPTTQYHDVDYTEDDMGALPYQTENQDQIIENQIDEDGTKVDNETGDDPKWWDSESQYLLDSQQLVEGLSLCDDLLASQSPNRDEHDNDTDKNKEKKCKPSLADYAQLGPEDLKKDLEECQHLVLDPANIDMDTPPDFRLSQLEFGSQDSYIAWGGSKFGFDSGEHVG